MTVKTYYSLECDYKQAVGCHRTFSTLLATEDLEKLVRLAKQWGWRQNGDKHTCSRCTTLLEYLDGKRTEQSSEQQ